MTTTEDNERIHADRQDQLPLGELRPDDRGQDEVREDLEESIGRGGPRPLTREEREAAARDPGPAKRSMRQRPSASPSHRCPRTKN